MMNGNGVFSEDLQGISMENENTQDVNIEDVNAQYVEIAPNNTWICGCGQENSNAFCSNCGSKNPNEATAVSTNWKCSSCGTDNSGNFCINCGNYRPQGGLTWKCGCGVENAGNFCYNCGAKKGGQAPQNNSNATLQSCVKDNLSINTPQKKVAKSTAPSLNISYDKQTTTNYTEQFMKQQKHPKP